MTLGAAEVMAHALRVMYQFLFRPGSSYTPNMFDFFFDWSTLFIIGAIWFIIGIVWFITSFRKNTLPKAIVVEDDEEPATVVPVVSGPVENERYIEIGEVEAYFDRLEKRSST